MHERIRQVAEEDGYELVHGEESSGRDFFGLLIFVKMSERKFDDKDYNHVYDAARALRRGFKTVSANVDPEAAKSRASYRREIEDIYRAAGTPAIYMEEIPNGYCSEPCCLNKPWFRVTSSIGHVDIGWRKRVISIDWKDTQVKASGKELFPDEDVTRDATGIHAWGAEKAAEYLQRLHRKVEV
jgi:hypothetical protein